jgi:hypothetical protein
VADPKDLDRTLPLGGSHAAPTVQGSSPQAVNPFAAPPPQPHHVNPFAAPPAPPQHVNPFAAAPLPQNPFAPPPLQPQPQPVNPFAGHAPLQAAPYPQPYPQQHPQQHPQPYPIAVGPALPVMQLRPLTVLVTLASAMFLAMQFYALSIQLELQGKVFTDLDAYLAAGDRAEMAEKLFYLALGGVVVTVAAWLLLASRNAHRLCADKPRFTPWLCFISFIIPVVNIVGVGLVMEDIWKHSHERRQPRDLMIMIFGRAVVYLFLARVVAAFLQMPTLDLIGNILSLTIPVLGVTACFKIEKAQHEADRRRRASAL